MDFYCPIISQFALSEQRSVRVGAYELKILAINAFTNSPKYGIILVIALNQD